MQKPMIETMAHAATMAMIATAGSMRNRRGKLMKKHGRAMHKTPERRAAPWVERTRRAWYKAIARACSCTQITMNVDDHPQSPSVARKTVLPPGEGWRVRRPLDFLVPWDSAYGKSVTKTERLVVAPARKKD